MDLDECLEAEMNPDDYPEILRVADVASLLRAAPRTVQLWAESGKLKAFKVGRGWRFRRDDVGVFLELQLHADPK
jgi:excisionase family DNA binding protein